jgi:hypothetical protein
MSDGDCATSGPAYMQTRCATRCGGHALVHLLRIPILFGVATVLVIDHQMPESAKFLHGGVYRASAGG